jgi:TonB family protein
MDTEPIAELKPIETPQPSVAKEETLRARRSQAEELQKKDAVSGVGYVASKRIIRGKVTSSEDGSQLPGVNVIVKGTTIGTVTNIEGAYEVEVSIPNPTLVYSFIGLQSKEVVANERSEIDVQLNTDMAQLSEVVVTGYGTSNREVYSPTVDLAHPEIGYRDYKKYLEENIHYPQQALTNKIEGRVTIEFFVEPNGSLSDFQIIRGIGYGCEEELTRLIKEGPSWVPTKKDNAPVRDKARVRLKFTLPKQK